MKEGKLKELREKQGWTQEELAEKLEVSRVFINRMENGHRNPSVYLLKKMSKLFKVEMKDFF